MPTLVPATTYDAGAGVGPYESLFVIGRGGMGSVEVALERGPSGFERVVALKRLLPESASDPRRKEMFLREARLASLLDHRNVVHTFAFGELHGELFLAMEYVEGEPLSRVLGVPDEACAEGAPRLEPLLVCHVLAEVCEGLHAAHELRDVDRRPLRVVHRDVSPHNIMIAYDGGIKLLDFGVAKFEAAGHQTRTGEVKGKMAYMSPEQALGEKLDQRTDLFSVGAVLFECLAGAPMWGPGTDLEIMRKLALEEPPGLDRAWPEAPRALVDLHSRLVARDPQRRPATALLVANELRAFVAANPFFAGDAVLRKLMFVRFGAQAARRRILLTEALERAAPSRADVLRRSLSPGGRRETALRTDPADLRGQKKARHAARGIFLIGIAAVSVVGAAALAMKTVLNGPGAKSRVISTTSSGASAPMTPIFSAEPATKASPHATDPLANDPSERVSAAGVPASAGPTVLPARVGPTADGASPKTAAGPHVTLSPPQPSHPSPPKLPDVDPAPF